MNKILKITRSERFKAVLLVVGAAFGIWLIARHSPPYLNSTAEVSLKIAVDCDSVGEIWCDFSLGGKDLGTMNAGVLENGVRAPFERGDVASMNIPAAAFGSAGELLDERFGFTLTVYDVNGKAHPVRCEGAEFSARLGGKYSYTLTRENGEYYCV